MHAIKACVEGEMQTHVLWALDWGKW